MNTKMVGRQGEEIAAAYLKKKGYKILAARYACRFGEIDIIAQQKKEIVFVEVKTRKNDNFARACESVNFYKQQRIKSTALLWLSANNPNDYPARFDVVEVYTDIDGKAGCTVNHIVNAFS